MTETREILIRLQVEYPPIAMPPTSAEMFPAYKIGEVAKLLQIGESTVFELIATGELESFKVAKARRVTRDALERYVRGLHAKGGGDAA